MYYLHMFMYTYIGVYICIYYIVDHYSGIRPARAVVARPLAALARDGGRPVTPRAQAGFANLKCQSEHVHYNN